MAEGPGKKVGKTDYPPDSTNGPDIDAEKKLGIDVGESFPVSNILEAARKNEKKENDLIDKNIEARKATNGGVSTAIADAFANPKPLKERKNGVKNSVNTETPKVQVAPKIETNEIKAIPPELKEIYGDRDVPSESLEVYLKLPSSKKKSYLDHLAVLQAEKIKKERRSFVKGNKKSSNPKKRTQNNMPVSDAIDVKNLDIELESGPTQIDIDLSEPKIIANPDEAADQDHIQEILGNKDGTPKEWREKLRMLIMDSEKRVVGDERAERLNTFLLERSKAFGENAKEYGPKIVEFIGSLSEKYNKLDWKTKLTVTGVLILGVSLTATASPLVSGALGVTLYGQRVLGSIGFGMNKRKALDAKIAANPDYWLAGKSELVKNTYATALAAVYMGGTAFAVHEGVEALNELGVNEWLGEKLGHSQTPSSETVKPTPISMPEAPVPAVAATAAVAEAAIPVAPEIPPITVNATTGHGYEYMLKQMWDQLQNKELDPSKYPKGSDIQKLLTATPETINKVVHDIASTEGGHGFYKPDGTSVIVRMGDMLTFNTDGQVMLMNTEGSANVQAPVGADVTPVLNAEAPTTVPVYPDGIVPPDTSAAARDYFEITHPPEQVAEAPTQEARTYPSLERVEVTSPEPVQTVDLTQGQTPTEAPSNTVEISPNTYVNNYGTSIDPDVAHGYMSAKGVYLFGGDKILDAQAQEYAQEHKVSVFVDKSYKLLGLINVSRVVEFVPTENGPSVMVIHNDPSLVPDPKAFTKRLF